MSQGAKRPQQKYATLLPLALILVRLRVQVDKLLTTMEELFLPNAPVVEEEPIVFLPTRRRRRRRWGYLFALCALLVASGGTLYQHQHLDPTLSAQALPALPLAAFTADNCTAPCQAELARTPKLKVVPVPVALHTPVTWPFARARAERVPNGADMLPAWYADGRLCSSGCLAPDVIPGWPLRPFHKQHALRNGFNELRTDSFHHGIDIQAYDRQKVYAIQPGYAQILQASGGDTRVQVGNFIYWHINLQVTEGEYVTPYQTLLGTVMAGFGHIAFSEVDSANNYLNPLRPGGRALSPWSDTALPIIGLPHVSPDGQAEVSAFDPQSFHIKTTYLTPVIAPVAVAWRLWDNHGQAVTPLEWSLRGTYNLPWSDDTLVFTPEAHGAGFSCFALRLVCRPDWRYVLAGGLTPPITLPGVGRFRLSVYAWGAGGVVGARDVWLTTTPNGIRELP